MSSQDGMISPQTRACCNPSVESTLVLIASLLAATAAAGPVRSLAVRAATTRGVIYFIMNE